MYHRRRRGAADPVDLLVARVETDDRQPFAARISRNTSAPSRSGRQDRAA
jgi:hypothetical protein